MERPVIFLQFLLVLVVAKNVLSSCNCGIKSTIKEAVCNRQTLIMATPESMEFADRYGHPVTNQDDAYLTTYKMYLNVMYHEGHNKLANNEYFELVTPKKTDDCGVEFELNTDYYLAGTALNGTHFIVHSCDYVERVPWFEKTAEEIEQINDLLTLQTQNNCDTGCTAVNPYGAIIRC